MKHIFKKSISILLAALMIVSCMSGLVFAAGGAAIAANVDELVLDGDKKSFTMTLTNVNETPIAGAEIILHYDTTAFSAVATFGAGMAVGLQEVADGYQMIWANLTGNVSNKDFATITFTVKDGAYNGKYPVSVELVELANFGGEVITFTAPEAPIVEVKNGKEPDPLPALTLSQTAYTYDGTEKAPAVTVGTLVEGDNYTLSDDLKATEAGTYTVTATGKGKFQGTQTATWTIAPAEITVSGITAVDRAYAKDNKEVAIDASAMAVAGKVGSDDVNVVVANKATVGAADVGTYEATLDVSLTGAAAKNYVLADASQKTASVVIEKAAAQALTAPEKGMLFSSTAPYVFGVEQISGLIQDAGVEEVKAVSVSGSSNVKAELADGAASITLAEGLTEANEGETAVVEITFSSKNYKDSTVKVPVKIIDKFDISGQITFAAGTAVYTGETFTHETATTTVAGGQWTYTYAGDMTNAGTHKVTATYETEDSIGSVEVDFVITPAVMAAPTATATKVYDGNADAAAEQVKVQAAAGAEYTVAVKSGYVSADVAKSAGNVQVEITLTGMTANNYNFENGTDVIAIEADGKITAKEITATAAVSGSYSYTGSAVKAEVAVTSSDATLTDADYDVSYENNVEAGEAKAIVTSSASSNYKFSAETTFEIAKSDATVKVEYVEKQYDGEGFTGDNVYYVATFNDEDIEGEWTVTAADAEWNAGEYTVDLKFVPANKSLNEATFNGVKATIEKTTIGYGWNEVKKAGVLLSDVEIEFYDVKGEVMNGELTWIDEDGAEINAEETKVEANVEYSFKFVPEDTKNYETLEDSIVLYSVIVDGYPTNVIITASSKQHGSVSVNPAAPETGDKVVINIAPDAGYAVEEVIVRNEAGKELKVTKAADNKYIFVMPAGQVTVKVVYDKATVKFLDVADTAWYAESVREAVGMGLFTGVSDNYFQPDGSMTRAMLVTVLWRLEGSPAAGSASFDDVAKGAWYDEAVAWANKEGIVLGMSETEFAPNASITREQMATMLFRYAKYCGYDVSVGENTNILSYGDAFGISEWAMPAMQWACGEGLIQGFASGNTMNLAPQGTATRAQVATILVRFVDTYQ